MDVRVRLNMNMAKFLDKIDKKNSPRSKGLNVFHVE